MELLTQVTVKEVKRLNYSGCNFVTFTDFVWLQILFRFF